MASLSDLHLYDGNSFSYNTALPFPPIVHCEKSSNNFKNPDLYESSQHLYSDKLYSSVGEIPPQYISLDHCQHQMYHQEYLENGCSEFPYEVNKRPPRTCSDCAIAGKEMSLSSDDQNEFNFDGRDLLGFYDDFSSLEYPDVFDDVIEKPHFSYESADSVGKSNPNWTLSAYGNNPLGTHKHRGAANKRERKRMQIINTAFEKLRKHVPCVPYEKKLSKVDTLKSAIDYIKFMSRLLKTNGNSSESQKPRKKIVVLCKKEDNSAKKSKTTPEVIGHSLSWSWDNSHSENEKEKKEEQLKLPLYSGNYYRGQLHERKLIKAPVWHPMFPGTEPQNNKTPVQEKSFPVENVNPIQRNEPVYYHPYEQNYTHDHFSGRYVDYTENRAVVSPLTEAMRIIVPNPNEVDSEFYTSSTALPPVSSLITNDCNVLGQYSGLVNGNISENSEMVGITNNSPVEHIKISKNSGIWHNMQFPMQLPSVHPLFVK